MKRILVVSFLILIFILCITIVVQPTKITVLTYHDFVSEETNDSMQISVSKFEQEIKYLKRFHYRSLKLKDMECFMKKKCTLPKKSVLITMDDGWKSELELAAPILKKYDMNAVIFYVGEHINGDNSNFMDRDDLERLKEEYPNIEIASHSYALHVEDAYQLPKEQIREDILLMKEEIDSKYFAYPYGRYSKDYQEVLQEEGYSLAFTFGPDKEHRKASRKDNCYAIPRLNVSHDMSLWKFILRLNWFN